MAKIKILYTGGTIGSQINDSVADVVCNTEFPLFDYYKAARTENNVDFFAESLINVLSENISFSDWETIYNRMYDINRNDCDGIILTHGTDTLAYTAIFLSIMLSHIDVPVLIVSSNYPLDDKRTNGYANFTAAVDFILNVGVRGVYVPYAEGDIVKMHLGSRLHPIQTFSHNFASIGNCYFGIMQNEIFQWNNNKYNPTLDELNISSLIKIPKFHSANNIQIITPYPGLDYSTLSFTDNPVAVLHGLYHSGTACTTATEEKFSILPFIHNCQKKGVDFYIAPLDTSCTVYKTTKEMLDAGVKFVSNTSFEASYVKLMIAYSVFDDEQERRDFLDKNIAFEKIIQRS
ncbi:MAG: asparaginase [Clostridiales bacterium]|nr:asparaginase [Clostridiales bacterium]